METVQQWTVEEVRKWALKYVKDVHALKLVENEVDGTGNLLACTEYCQEELF